MPEWWELPVTQGYGPTSERLDGPYAGYAHFNKGIDYGGQRGLPIKVPPWLQGGKVVRAGEHPNGWGIQVWIQAADGTIHNFGHMDAASVKVGQTVTPGMVIGALGNTGASTGPHLSYDVMRGSEFIDPSPYIKGGGSVPAAPATPPPVGPAGRTFAQIKGTEYLSSEERDWYHKQEGSPLPPVQGGTVTRSYAQEAPGVSNEYDFGADEENNPQFYIYKDGNTIIAVDRTSGAEAWRRQITPSAESNADPNVYTFKDGDNIVGINRLTGAELWRRPVAGEATAPKLSQGAFSEAELKAEGATKSGLSYVLAGQEYRKNPDGSWSPYGAAKEGAAGSGNTALDKILGGFNAINKNAPPAPGTQSSSTGPAPEAPTPAPATAGAPSGYNSIFNQYGIDKGGQGSYPSFGEDPNTREQTLAGINMVTNAGQPGQMIQHYDPATLISQQLPRLGLKPTGDMAKDLETAQRIMAEQQLYMAAGKSPTEVASIFDLDAKKAQAKRDDELLNLQRLLNPEVARGLSPQPMAGGGTISVPSFPRDPWPRDLDDSVGGIPFDREMRDLRSGLDSGGFSTGGYWEPSFGGAGLTPFQVPVRPGMSGSQPTMGTSPANSGGFYAPEQGTPEESAWNAVPARPSAPTPVPANNDLSSSYGAAYNQIGGGRFPAPRATVGPASTDPEMAGFDPATGNSEAIAANRLASAASNQVPGTVEEARRLFGSPQDWRWTPDGTFLKFNGIWYAPNGSIVAGPLPAMSMPPRYRTREQVMGQQRTNPPGMAEGGALVTGNEPMTVIGQQTGQPYATIGEMNALTGRPQREQIQVTPLEPSIPIQTPMMQQPMMAPPPPPPTPFAVLMEQLFADARGGKKKAPTPVPSYA